MVVTCKVHNYHFQVVLFELCEHCSFLLKFHKKMLFALKKKQHVALSWWGKEHQTMSHCWVQFIKWTKWGIGDAKESFLHHIHTCTHTLTVTWSSSQLLILRVRTVKLWRRWCSLQWVSEPSSGVVAWFHFKQCCAPVQSWTSVLQCPRSLLV